MVERPAVPDVARGTAVDAFPGWRAAHPLFGICSTRQVAAWACLPTLAGVALLLMPGHLFSREMTWDLLYNLEGAWHLVNGHVPHVDFHTPLGVLTFAFTRVGFWFAGIGPQAALAGPLILTGPAVAAGALVAARRLPLLPALLFTVYVALLILLPTNVGDQPNAYSLAMSYNRFGWSALTILCLALFVPPRAVPRRGWIEPLLGGALLLFLFYLKVTYAVAGCAAVVAAVGLMAHVRRDWRLWAGVAVAIAANAVAPYNHPYLADIWLAADNGHARVDVASQLLAVVANRGEFAVYGIACLFLSWLWQRGRTDGATVAASVVVVALGVFVLSQNSQAGDMPVAVVACFLVYQVLWRGYLESPTTISSPAATILVAVLVWPMLAVAAQTATLAAYFRAASRPDGIAVATVTNLRGLAVPADGRELEASLEASPYRMHSPLRDPPLRDPISQHQYVRSLLAAAALFAGDDATVRVLVLDQVNAMPFVLGYPPPRRSRLWFLPEDPPRPAADVFGDVDVVLVPKYATLARSTIVALDTYGGYLAETYRHRQDTESWTVLRRTPVDRAAGPDPGTR